MPSLHPRPAPPQALLRASLLTSTYLQAMEITQNKISYQVRRRSAARTAWHSRAEQAAACLLAVWGPLWLSLRRNGNRSGAGSSPPVALLSPPY